MKKIIIAIYLFLNFSSAFAENYLFVVGGGGEPLRTPYGNANTKTIFDDNLSKISEFKNSEKYKTKVTFNGGHLDTEKIISTNFGPDEILGETFDKKSWDNAIGEYEKKIKNGEIKTGDQVLIYIDTHGASKGKGEETHEIALGRSPLTNYEKLGSSTVSLDQLKNLTKLAKEKGIKLGILDFSCHSGNTLALMNENTCVISSTGPNHYGYGGSSDTFSAHFMDAFKKGKTLEDVYLEVRDNFKDSSFPMISSPVGVDVQNELYDLIGPYLYSFDYDANKLKNHLDKTFSKEDMCRDEVNFKQLNDLIEQIKILSNFARMSLNSNQAYSLQQNLKTYYEYQQEIKMALQEGGKGLLTKKEEFCQPYQETIKGKKVPNKICMDYSWEQLVTINYDSIISYWNDTSKQKKGNELQESMAYRDLVKKAKERSIVIQAQYPKLKELNKIYDNLEQKENKTVNLAYKISLNAQSLYMDQYRIKAQADSRPNPCKDFRL